MNSNTNVIGFSTNGRGFDMKKCSKLIQEEVTLIKKIQKDEAWLEGERRNAYVDLNDNVVKEKIDNLLSSHIKEIEVEALRHCYKDDDEDCRKCKECICK